MCGIAGILNLSSSKRINKKQLKELISVIRHRGPDELGAYIDDNIGLVHSRLSIIDLEGGTQPVHNEDKTLWIIFNGEIYNYKELRSDLIKKGHKFYTTTDTEVIIHLYEVYGFDFLNYLNGQFAFAIWDSKINELFLARDRLGIRPLHYTFSDGQLIFASEIKSIFTQKNVNRSIDHHSLNHIFRYWTTLPGSTFFEEIKELPPAHYLRISAVKHEVKKYWDIPYYSNEEKLDWSLDKFNRKIYELLLDSVKLRLRADVTVGAYLSGGLDSSVVASIVKNNFNNELKTFGIRFSDKEFDEGHYQNQIVDRLETEHKEIIADDINIAGYFSDALWNIEKPVLRTAPVPLYLLSHLVNKNNLKVVLTGEGADEFFGGYNIFREAKARWFWSKNPDSQIRPKLLARIYPYILKDNRLNLVNQSFFKRGIDQADSPFFSHQIRWDNMTNIGKLILKDHEKYHSADADLFDTILPNDFENRDYFEKAQYLEVKTFLSNYLLSSQGDRMAMANSVEIRFPYLDHRLIELLAKIPSRLKIYGMNEKFLLKRGFRDILPEEITKRAKHPYRAPISNSLLSKSNSVNFDKYCSHEAINNAAIFKQTSIDKFFKKARDTNSPSEGINMAISFIYSTQVIYDKFINNFPGTGNTNFKFDLLIDKRKQN